MDIIRIATAGSVDDGKSTLIGRLLYDTRSITNDRLEALEASSRRKGLDFTDLSLLTDGLIAEREQGITIDVAYIYFSTPNKKFIIADTPGHIEYTRNMITGASTASVFLILVDARQGITEQTKRHFYIASLLRIKEIAVCINKMDLVGFDSAVYDNIKEEFKTISGKMGIDGQDIEFIPVTAKHGDNIVIPSVNMEWYRGFTLLQFLESIQPAAGLTEQPARFPVQYVIRPQSDAFPDFRGYAGRLTSGRFEKGDEVLVLPSRKTSTIESILVDEEEKVTVSAQQSVVITLKDDIDVSRGNMIVKKNEGSIGMDSFRATICWMDDQPLSPGKMLLVQHGPNRVKAKVVAIEGVLDIHHLEMNGLNKQFSLNDIGRIRLKTAKHLFADFFSGNAANGNFILVDEYSNHTVAAGFVEDADS